MPHHRLRLLAVPAALAALGAVAPVAGAATTPKIRVVASEYKFAFAATAKPGAVLIQLVNRGDTRHDLLLRKLNARGKPTGPSIKIGPVQPDKSAQKRVTLSAGRYSFVCTIGDHAAQGMNARLAVRK